MEIKHFKYVYLLIVFLVTLTIFFSAAGKELSVCHLGCKYNLKEAVAVAEDGDRIIVKPGNYDADIRIDKDITLKGVDEGEVKLRGGLRIGPSPVTVRILGIILSNSTKHGISLFGDAEAIIEDTTVTENLSHSLYLSGSAEITIIDSLIKDGGKSGLYASDGTEVKIRSTTISNNGSHGIELKSNSSLNMKECKMASNGGFGLYVYSGDKSLRENLILEHFTFSNNRKGATNNSSILKWFDTKPPVLDLLQEPDRQVKEDEVEFKWSGEDEFTSVSNLSYSYYLEGYEKEYSEWQSKTGMEYEGLTTGSFTFRLRARDEAGNTRRIKKEFEVVDAGSPRLKINEFPLTTTKQRDITINWRAKDDFTAQGDLAYSYYLEGCEEDWSDWTRKTSKKYQNLLPGNFTFHLRVKDKAGNIAKSEGSFLLQARTFDVCSGDCDYRSVQQAITSARNGDIIEIKGGDYEEDLVIDKGLTIKGEGASSTVKGSIKVGPSDTSVNIKSLSFSGESSSFTIRGKARASFEQINITSTSNSCISLKDQSVIVIKGSELKGEAPTIHALDSGKVTVENTDLLSGTKVEGSATLNIRDSKITGSDILVKGGGEAKIHIIDTEMNAISGGRGVLLEDKAQLKAVRTTVNKGDTGLELNDSAKANLVDSKFTRNGIGLRAKGDSYLELRETTVEKSRADSGIKFFGNSGGLIDQSVITECKKQGIEISPSENRKVNVEVLDSTISKNGSSGIISLGERKLTVSGSRITRNERSGIALSGGKSTLIEDTKVVGNTVGISLGSDANIKNLTVTENETGLITSGSSQVKISNSLVSSSGIGLSVEEQSRIDLQTTTVNANNSGIIVKDAAQSDINDSRIKGNSTGIRILDGGKLNLKKSDISANSKNGIVLTDSASAFISGNVIAENKRYGIMSRSSGVTEGSENKMLDNGTDLVGSLSGKLRVTLEEASRAKLRFPNKDFPSLQHAVDALVPGGILLVDGGTYESGVTVDKKVTIKADESGIVYFKAKDKGAAFSLLNIGKLILKNSCLVGGIIKSANEWVEFD